MERHDSAGYVLQAGIRSDARSGVDIFWRSDRQEADTVRSKKAGKSATL